MTRKKIVVVLGMHRSGTSAITRSLQVLGVSLGENLHPAGFDNPKGFWEDSDVVKFNEQLLRLLGSAYDRVGLATSPLRLEDFSQELIDTAVNFLKSKTADTLVWGVKDPRISRLLVFWQHVFEVAGLDAVYVIAFRSPLSVADSLAKRNGFRRSKSFYLWLEHVLPSLMLTEGRPRVVINYDKLMDDPRYEIGRMKAALGLEIVSAQALQEYEQEFLDDSLRHTSYSSGDLESCLDAPDSLKRLFSLLCDVASEKVSLSAPEVSAEVNGIHADLSANASLLRLVADLESDLQLAREELHLREVEQVAVASQLHHDLAGTANEQQKIIADLSTRLSQFEKFSRFAADAFSVLFASDKWREWAGNASLQRESESHSPFFLALLLKAYNFDSRYYLSTNPDVAYCGMNAAEHFIAFGAMEGRHPFAADDSVAPGMGGLAGNEFQGRRREVLERSGFNPALYLALYPDVVEAGMDPYQHFVQCGAFEGRIGNHSAFDVAEAFQHFSLDAKNVLIVASSTDTGAWAPSFVKGVAQALAGYHNVVVLVSATDAEVAAFRELDATVVSAPTLPGAPDLTGLMLMTILENCRIDLAVMAGEQVSAWLLPLVERFLPVLSVVEAECLNQEKGDAAAWQQVAFWSSGVLRYRASTGEIAFSTRLDPNPIRAYGGAQEGEWFKLVDVALPLKAFVAGVHARAQQEKADFLVIQSSGCFEPEFLTVEDPYSCGPGKGLRSYVRGWANGLMLMRPLPGFHPGIYRDKYPQACTGMDPFAAYIRAGEPEGPWLQRVLSPLKGSTDDMRLAGARVALCLRVRRSEFVDEILRRLALNSLIPDLFMVVDDAAMATQASSIAQRHGMHRARVEVSAFQQEGIGSLAQLFRQQDFAGTYDLVGYFHDADRDLCQPSGHSLNKCDHVLLDKVFGDASCRIADMIVGRMLSDVTLGMVFPVTSSLPSIPLDCAVFNELAAKLGYMAEGTAGHALTSAGSMFWARPQAVRPALERLHGWSVTVTVDKTDEERMDQSLAWFLPVECERSGFTFALMDYRKPL